MTWNRHADARWCDRNPVARGCRILVLLAPMAVALGAPGVSGAGGEADANAPNAVVVAQTSAAPIATVAVAADGPANTATADDLKTRALLSDVLARNQHVRVTTAFERFDVRSARIDDAGLHYRGGFQRGVPESELPASPIPWSKVQRIEAAHSHLGTGALLGAVLGLVAGIAWNSASPPHRTAGLFSFGPTDAGVGMGRILLTTCGGVVLGTAVAQSTHRWNVLYPSARDAESR